VLKLAILDSIHSRHAEDDNFDHDVSNQYWNWLFWTQNIPAMLKLRGATRPNDWDQMTNRNVTKWHFEPNWNETEHFSGLRVRPNHILRKIVRRPNHLFATIRTRPNYFELPERDRILRNTLAHGRHISKFFPITGGYEYIPEKNIFFCFITSCRSDGWYLDWIVRPKVSTSLAQSLATLNNSVLYNFM
jgi:hypothetical protein